MIDAKTLMARTFAPIEYVVPGIIPEGLSMLVAAPKIGKSWMVLGLGLACAAGGNAFGSIRVDERPVLYLALEDGHRRLKSRLLSIGATHPPRSLYFMTNTLPGAALETIAEFMDTNADKAPLVILDTLGKVLRSSAGNETQYERDYRVIGDLKRMADRTRGSSVIVVHHTRKADGGDFIDAISGTQGIAGAADTILLLKRNRQETTATLQVTSRDAAEGEYSLTLSPAGNWTLNGTTLEEAAAQAHNTDVTEGLGDRMAEVINAVSRHPEGITTADLKTLLNPMKPADVDSYLKRGADTNRIQRTGRGKYAPLPITAPLHLKEVSGM
jgi:RecA-family ATPase